MSTAEPKIITETKPLTRVEKSQLVLKANEHIKSLRNNNAIQIGIANAQFELTCSDSPEQLQQFLLTLNENKLAFAVMREYRTSIEINVDVIDKIINMPINANEPEAKESENLSQPQTIPPELKKFIDENNTIIKEKYNNFELKFKSGQTLEEAQFELIAPDHQTLFCDDYIHTFPNGDETSIVITCEQVQAIVKQFNSSSSSTHREDEVPEDFTDQQDTTDQLITQLIAELTTRGVNIVHSKKVRLNDEASIKITVSSMPPAARKMLPDTWLKDGVVISDIDNHIEALKKIDQLKCFFPKQTIEVGIDYNREECNYNFIITPDLSLSSTFDTLFPTSRQQTGKDGIREYHVNQYELQSCLDTLQQQTIERTKVKSINLPEKSEEAKSSQQNNETTEYIQSLPTVDTASSDETVDAMPESLAVESTYHDSKENLASPKLESEEKRTVDTLPEQSAKKLQGTFDTYLSTDPDNFAVTVTDESKLKVTHQRDPKNSYSSSILDQTTSYFRNDKYQVKNNGNITILVIDHTDYLHFTQVLQRIILKQQLISHLGQFNVSCIKWVMGENGVISILCREKELLTKLVTSVNSKLETDNPVNVEEVEETAKGEFKGEFKLVLQPDNIELFILILKAQQIQNRLNELSQNQVENNFFSHFNKSAIKDNFTCTYHNSTKLTLLQAEDPNLLKLISAAIDNAEVGYENYLQLDSFNVNKLVFFMNNKTWEDFINKKLCKNIRKILPDTLTCEVNSNNIDFFSTVLEDNYLIDLQDYLARITGMKDKFQLLKNDGRFILPVSISLINEALLDEKDICKLLQYGLNLIISASGLEIIQFTLIKSMLFNSQIQVSSISSEINISDHIFRYVQNQLSIDTIVEDDNVFIELSQFGMFDYFHFFLNCKEKSNDLTLKISDSSLNLIEAPKTKSSLSGWYPSSLLSLPLSSKAPHPKSSRENDSIDTNTSEQASSSQRKQHWQPRANLQDIVDRINTSEEPLSSESNDDSKCEDSNSVVKFMPLEDESNIAIRLKKPSPYRSDYLNMIHNAFDLLQKLTSIPGNIQIKDQQVVVPAALQTHLESSNFSELIHVLMTHIIEEPIISDDQNAEVLGVCVVTLGKDENNNSVSTIQFKYTNDDSDDNKKSSLEFVDSQVKHKKPTLIKIFHTKNIKIQDSVITCKHPESSDNKIWLLHMAKIQLKKCYDFMAQFPDYDFKITENGLLRTKKAKQNKATQASWTFRTLLNWGKSSQDKEFISKQEIIEWQPNVDHEKKTSAAPLLQMKQ